MMRRIVIAGLIASSVSACASVGQAVSTYGSIAVSNAQAANDTLIEANKRALCAIPLSALQRHPELVPAVKSLCLGQADDATASVIDAIPKAQAK